MCVCLFVCFGFVTTFVPQGKLPMEYLQSSRTTLATCHHLPVIHTYLNHTNMNPSTLQTPHINFFQHKCNQQCKGLPRAMYNVPSMTRKQSFKCTASTCQIDSVLWGERTAVSTAAAQCAIAGATPQVLYMSFIFVQ